MYSLGWGLVKLAVEGIVLLAERWYYNHGRSTVDMSQARFQFRDQSEPRRLPYSYQSAAGSPGFVQFQEVGRDGS